MPAHMLQDPNLEVQSDFTDVAYDVLRDLLIMEERAEKEQAEQRKLELEWDTEVKRWEAEKKKPKLNDFDKGKIVGDVITPHPSPYALNKLQNFKLVKLFYFTHEGCLDATQHAHTTADDAFGLTKADGFVTLRPVAAFKALRNIVQDEDLTWDQMILAKDNMLNHMEQMGWSVKHVTALVTFFFNIECHPL
ncbi:hypothetical protein JAAARDRAFT_192448 [Jaapia argillacea MUCL 33604]|uniref:Uncharacterized protein n=1 Tax=Jaapia argillacea MUCL 33604 TaxID=933084 RepID=A0A067PVM0_9AGAM|nr:hypothetical protein JAAARDRAFT_192448 [Jaapia argillacea MUCL 33604]